MKKLIAWEPNPVITKDLRTGMVRVTRIGRDFTEKLRYTRSRYFPHQGARECARRRAQRGIKT